MANPKIATVIDKFAYQYPSSEVWDFLGQPTTDKGRLRLAVNQGIRTKRLYDFKDSQAFAEVFVEGTVATFIFNFLLTNDDGIGTELHGNALWFKLKKGGVLSTEFIPYDPDKHKKWRMRERYGVLLWETSADNANWDIQRQAYHGLDLTAGKLLLMHLPVSGGGFGDGLFGDDLFGGEGTIPVFAETGYGAGPYNADMGYGVI